MIVYCGATEIGQGSDDVLAVVAEALGVEIGNVRVVTGDTGITPVDLGSYSSRVTIMAGTRLRRGRRASARLLAQASAALLADDGVVSQGNPTPLLVFAASRPAPA